MSRKKYESEASGSLTVREYLAGQALGGLMAQLSTGERHRGLVKDAAIAGCTTQVQIAREAVLVADAMIQVLAGEV